MWQLLEQAIDSPALLGKEINKINEQLREIQNYPIDPVLTRGNSISNKRVTPDKVTLLMYII